MDREKLMDLVNTDFNKFQLEIKRFYKEDYVVKLEQQCKKQKEVIDKIIHYIEYDMPYLQEIDKEYEDINGNTYFTYKEYNTNDLLDMLKEVSE